MCGDYVHTHVRRLIDDIRCLPQLPSNLVFETWSLIEPRAQRIGWLVSACHESAVITNAHSPCLAFMQVVGVMNSVPHTSSGSTTDRAIPPSGKAERTITAMFFFLSGILKRSLLHLIHYNIAWQKEQFVRDSTGTHRTLT